jgi:hypothetical protein
VRGKICTIASIVHGPFSTCSSGGGRFEKDCCAGPGSMQRDSGLGQVLGVVSPFLSDR